MAKSLWYRGLRLTKGSASRPDYERESDRLVPAASDSLRRFRYQAIPLPATDFKTPSRLSTGLRYICFETTCVAFLTGSFGERGLVLLESCIIESLFESFCVIYVIANRPVGPIAMGWKAGITFHCPPAP